MKTGNKQKNEEPAFIFSVDILIQGKTNGQAMERLLKLLNGSEDVTDYRITRGIELGPVVEQALRLAGEQKTAKPFEPARTAEAPVSAKDNGQGSGTPTRKDGGKGEVSRKAAPEGSAQAGGKESRQAPPKPAGQNIIPSSLIQQITQYIADRTLVRLSVVKERGVKLSIPCRILNFDDSANNMTVYHVDEKKVYTFKLTEIDDLSV